MKKFRSIINSVTIDINPLLPDVLYIIEYSSGKAVSIYHEKLLSGSYDFSQRIHNFIYTGELCFCDSTITTYKNGQQNINHYHSYYYSKDMHTTDYKTRYYTC